MKKVSESTVGRLSLYLRTLVELARDATSWRVQDE